MNHPVCRTTFLGIVLCGAAAIGAASTASAFDQIPTPAASRTPAPKRAKPDLSGCQRVGMASVYARRLSGQPMADGTPMSIDEDFAASNTLPLGTKARVTMLATGRSAVVTIRDRGPHARGRILDLSPATARKIGLGGKRGVGRVSIAPLSIPLPDGGVREGAGDC
jgi:rare lipoprotein A